MPELQSSDPSRKIRTRYDLVGTSPVPSISGELVPVVVVDDLTGFDVQSAEFERPCMVNEVNAAVVARFPRIALMNPADSGVLGILEWLWITGSGAMQIEIGILEQTLAIADRGAFRDSRIPGVPACGTFQGDVAGPAERDFLIGIVITGNAPNQIFSLNMVFGPGFSIDVRGSVNNTTLQVQYMWRERTLLAGEQ